MNDVIAHNIRSFREERSWTQEQLAEAAQLNPRTIQRAEKGMGMSAETLLAIAGALDVPVEVLRTDPLDILARAFGVTKAELTPEYLETRCKEAQAQYDTIELTEVTSSGVLSGVFDSNAMMFTCQSLDDAVRDAAAELKQLLHDLMDLAGELDAESQRAYERDAFAVVARLNALGQAVSVAVHQAVVPGIRKAWPILSVVVTPKAELPTTVVVPKTLDL